MMDRGGEMCEVGKGQERVRLLFRLRTGSAGLFVVGGEKRYRMLVTRGVLCVVAE